MVRPGEGVEAEEFGQSAMCESQVMGMPVARVAVVNAHLIPVHVVLLHDGIFRDVYPDRRHSQNRRATPANKPQRDEREQQNQ